MYTFKSKLIDPKYSRDLAKPVVLFAIRVLEEADSYLKRQGPGAFELITDMKNSTLFKLIPQILFLSTLKNFDSAILDKLKFDQYDFEVDELLLDLAKAYYAVRV